MSKLLFDEHPLVIDRTLAAAIGLNEAVIIQQVHYWVKINEKTRKNFVEGYYWTYNSYEAWQQQFPFWSYDTVKRTITKLKKKELLITAKHNKLKMDKTTWYRVNYEKLEKLIHGDNCDQGKMPSSMSAKHPDGEVQNEPTYTRDYTETKKTTTEKGKEDVVVNDLNKKEKSNSKTFAHLEEKEKSLYEMAKIGISNDQALQLCNEHTTGRISQVIDYTKKNEKIRNKPGFVVDALRNNWKIPDTIGGQAGKDKLREKTQQLFDEMGSWKKEAEEAFQGKNPFTLLRQQL